MIDCKGNGRFGIGSGIVADSIPNDEWDECLLKARVLTDLAADYGLIEMLRWSPNEGFCRLDLHLDRLQQAAARSYSDIADASWNGNLVEREEILLTPPLANGALRGGLRRSLLETSRARAGGLTLADLADAPRWYLAIACADSGQPGS